jgi:chemotaxis protein methyltransferase CheR
MLVAERVEGRILEKIINFVQKDKSLDLHQYRPSFIQRRIATRLRATGSKNYLDYYRLLKRDKDEVERLVHVLTIHVSEFFRDPSVFRILRHKILPSLMKRKERGGQRLMRFWSAGCAHGEEPYSLAMIALEANAEFRKKFSISVYATDIDEEVIEEAKRGVYEVGKIRNLPRLYKRKYFEELGGEFYQLREEVKRLVKFKLHDLLREPPLRYIDVLLCRNVIIYFSREERGLIVKKFYEALHPGGYLVLGKTETLSKASELGFKCIDLHERIYQKLAPEFVGGCEKDEKKG